MPGTLQKITCAAAAIALWAGLTASAWAEPIEVRRIPPSAPLAYSQIAPDARDVTAAVVRRLRGHSAAGIARDHKVLGAGAITPEADFNYQGFVLNRVKYRRRGAANTAGKARTLSGYLHFRDAIGRNAAAAFETTYAKTDGGVQIKSAAWTPLFADRPQIEMYIAPAKSVIKEIHSPNATYRRLYTLAIGAAIDLSNGATAHEDARDYIIFIFFKDRIAPDLEFSVHVRGEEQWRIGRSDIARQRRFDGWAVAVVPGQFAVNSETPIFIDVLTQPADAGFFSKKRLIARFSIIPRR